MVVPSGINVGSDSACSCVVAPVVREFLSAYIGHSGGTSSLQSPAMNYPCYRVNMNTIIPDVI